MFFGWFNAVFSIVFPLIFFGLMCLFIFTLISNLRTWNKNNHSPRLSIPAAVVAKRTDISHSDTANAGDLSGALQVLIVKKRRLRPKEAVFLI